MPPYLLGEKVYWGVVLLSGVFEMVSTLNSSVAEVDSIVFLTSFGASTTGTRTVWRLSSETPTGTMTVWRLSSGASNTGTMTVWRLSSETANSGSGEVNLCSGVFGAVFFSCVILVSFAKVALDKW